MVWANAFKLRAITAANNSFVFNEFLWQMSAVLPLSSFEVCALTFLEVARRFSSFPDVDPGNGVKQTNAIHQPQNDSNDHNAIENGLEGCLHWDEAIHQPQQNTDHDQHLHYLNQRHKLTTFLVSWLAPLIRLEALP